MMYAHWGEQRPGVHWSGRYIFRQMSAWSFAFNPQFEHDLSDDELQTSPRRAGGHGAIHSIYAQRKTEDKNIFRNMTQNQEWMIINQITAEGITNLQEAELWIFMKIYSHISYCLRALIIYVALAWKLDFLNCSWCQNCLLIQRSNINMNQLCGYMATYWPGGDIVFLLKT